ncbi:hypothetical protein KGF56_001116 [Candida oxycetoniae]|uniref:Uncharacterized protein n=1 Tax=Candida oxycetoniae TaxID=497107 RepID=A0AAI9SZZ3_9ASCO|nr:uncharacterized protein KGF56_001116 [Candida oxycetoniae]KAI3405897.2 hypothetical protein KGF56_001116 [Candida oxycetoniae]
MRVSKLAIIGSVLISVHAKVYYTAFVIRADENSDGIEDTTTEAVDTLTEVDDPFTETDQLNPPTDTTENNRFTDDAAGTNSLPIFSQSTETDEITNAQDATGFGLTIPDVSSETGNTRGFTQEPPTTTLDIASTRNSTTRSTSRRRSISSSTDTKNSTDTQTHTGKHTSTLSDGTATKNEESSSSGAARTGTTTQNGGAGAIVAAFDESGLLMAIIGAVAGVLLF